MHIQSVKGHGGAEGEGVGGKKKELHRYCEEFKAVSGKQEDGKANWEDKTQCGKLRAD